MTGPIMRLHESRVPEHFTPRMRAQVRYGTYSAEQIDNFEAMRAGLKTGKPLMMGNKVPSCEDKFQFTEYCVINAPDDLRGALERGIHPELLDPVREIEHMGYSPAGRSLGMDFLVSSGVLRWHLNNDMISRFRRGYRIMELGPGMGGDPMVHAANHPDHFVVSVEANAINIRGTYENLASRGRLTKPLPNLRVLFGDIRMMTPPQDFAADLLVANLVFAPGNNTDQKPQVIEEYKEMFNSFLGWSAPNATLRLTPLIKNDALSRYIISMMHRPENSGRELIISD